MGYLELEELRGRFISFIRTTIGLPYQWGGQGPDAYDCSGLIVAGLRHVGLMEPAEDATAAQLCQHYVDHGYPPCASINKPGLLCFYGTPVVHAMISLTTWSSGSCEGALVGARGGTSNTTTTAEAYRRGAMVCVVKADYWQSALSGVYDPFWYKGVSSGY